jgi:hypothetical protein
MSKIVDELKALMELFNISVNKVSNVEQKASLCEKFKVFNEEMEVSLNEELEVLTNALVDLKRHESGVRNWRDQLRIQLLECNDQDMEKKLQTVLLQQVDILNQLNSLIDQYISKINYCHYCLNTL